MNAQELQPIKSRYGIVGNCDALNHALDTALQVANTDMSVLITGESGVGKEVLPRIIHDNSLRRTRKYFAINCGAIPEGTIDSELFGHEKGAFTGSIGEHDGYFGVADGGTLFLDEVGELPLSTQARLLRVLESGEYIRVGSSQVRKTNVRIVAATNVNIQRAITEGKFREDLFYRLSTIPIKMPPLRERGEDVLLLFKKFAMEIATKYQMPERITLSADAAEIMKRYKWPGNIRQLKNITEQMSILMRDSRIVTPDILHEYEIWPSSNDSTALVAVNKDQGSHSYNTEREMLFQMIKALHDEVNDLRQQVLKIHGSSSGQSLGTTLSTPDHHSSQPHNDFTHISASQNEAQPDISYAEEYVEEPLDIREQERRLIAKALEKHRGRRKKAAEELNISERTLYRKIKEYGLEDI
ncbi:MAG: sigma-54-dependent Fis family transcriptional regulator [Bacteroidaceae bacterium]|nr:sigma-54-dependent Fis family transcriptional regulator [Bacteroidaceae bacterium]